MKSILYLASGSLHRKKLLEAACIPFQAIDQDADESHCSLQQPLQNIVCQLAQLKMQHVHYPVVLVGTISFFLTADTLTLDAFGNIYGKPADREDAKRTIRACRAGGIIVGTGFCLERKIYTQSGWKVQASVVDYDQGVCFIDVPETFLDLYLDTIPFLTLSGGMSIQGIGEQFLKQMQGSYSAILGLPMFKVRQALSDLGFYKQ